MKNKKVHIPHAFLLLLTLMMQWQQIHANTYTLINTTKFKLGACIHYVACSQDCWFPLEAGEKRSFNAGACMLQMIEADVLNHSAKKIIYPNVSGNYTWEVRGNDQSIDIVQTSSQNIGQIIGSGITDTANKAAEGIKQSAEAVYNESKKIYSTVLDTITAGKAKEGADKLRSIANTLEQLPVQIKKQITDITSMPDKLMSGVNDVTKTITQIQSAETDLQKQKADVVAQNLASKGLAELTQLNQTLMKAFDELEKGLTTLANTAGNAGILVDFKTALMQAKKDAEAGLADIQHHLDDLNNKITHPSLDYPSLPARIRAIASILNP